MDAKEYYKQFNTEDITENPDPDYDLSFYQNIFKLMESYHQAKSKEEAEDRYRLGCEHIFKVRGERKLSMVEQIALKLAAFGKEE